MRLRLTGFVLCAVLVIPPAGATEIYRSKSEDGTVEFSDRPGEGRERIEVEPGGGVSAADSEATMSGDEDEPENGTEETDAGAEETDESETEGDEVVYETLEIVEPAHDQAFYRNTPDLPVRVSLEPGLADDHAIVAWLDGERMDEPFTSETFSLEPVHLGEHQLRVAVVNEAGETLIESETITFYRLRHTQDD